MDVEMSALAPMAATSVEVDVCEPLVPAHSVEGGFVTSRSYSPSVEHGVVCAVFEPLAAANSAESVSISGVVEALTLVGRDCAVRAVTSAIAAT